MDRRQGRVPQETLKNFIDGTYGWKGLTPDMQMSMARELYAMRVAIRKWTEEAERHETKPA